MDATAPDSFLARALVDSTSPAEEHEEFSARILQAAHDVFCRLGIQRSTMEDVARAAGVARITIYRRFATKDVLVEHVVRREFRAYFAEFLDDIQRAETPADKVVIGFVSSLRAIRHNALIGGLMVTEPDAMLRSLVGDGGATLAIVRAFLAEQIRSGQRAGTLSPDLDVDLVAEMMVRVSTSFLVTPSLIVDLDDDEQVEAIARQFLVPMLTPR